MEDVRLGRKTRGNDGTVALTAGSTNALPFNLKRFSLILSAPVSGRYSVGFGVTAVLDSGLTLQAGGPPVVLGVKDHGAFVTDVINVIHSVGGVSAGFHEESLMED
jgi:hypothetical protein